MIFFFCFRNTGIIEAADYFLLLCIKLGKDLLFLSHNVIQGLTVDQMNFIGNLMYRHRRYETASMHLDKTVTELIFKLAQRHSGLVNPVTGSVYLGNIPFHKYIKNGIYLNHNFIFLHWNRYVFCFLHIRHLAFSAIGIFFVFAHVD